MNIKKCSNSGDLLPSSSMGALILPQKVHEIIELGKQESALGRDVEAEVDIDIREIYFLILHFLSAGPCQKAFQQLCNDLSEHRLLPRRYHAWFSRSGVQSGDEDDDGISFPLNYNNLVDRYPHIEKDHLAKLLKELMLCTTSPFQINGGAKALSAVDVPTLLGTGSFSLLDCERSSINKKEKSLPTYLRWPHMQADQVHGLSLREIGGGFRKHHRAPSVHSACYAIAKPSMMVQRMENVKKLRGHRVAVYCAIFDCSGRYVITGSDDRLVKIWSMETAFCLASCRGHEGDITDLAVTSNNQLVASASNDFVIRVWRLPDGHPISVLRGHTGAVTAIAFNPRPSSAYQLLSSSDDGTCRIWDARSSQCAPRIYVPKPPVAVSGKDSGLSVSGPLFSSSGQSHQILCCAYNANGTVFVTGSSDTFARVWSALKSNTDDPEQPIHEMDKLSGHENDVNYVQFSGCSVAPRSSFYDTLKEEKENIPKFKNSWFCHDNIVTCSRDGSAIIWAPKSRRPSGKGVRWVRSYHLKVPPPPLPPQPPRGGPRQRFLPTPRGVNMIVWSLDNHFVLAAIMDCRICVWNASDGSLVHSLTGHSASSYVLDVHPFDPRIAMSAGYDGKAIIWDIWKGTPIRTYEIGRVKLVDGKFSPDGTSIVLSDDFGQIHFVNTGQGESQKDAKYDQFFLGDYRPLIRDTLGNVLDQESQLQPHRRNVQDPLCDASLIPYQEPYQSMYQKRRLGALGIEWRPSSMQFAIGPDFTLGQDYQMPPLADVERLIEPLPDFLDAMFWEPENEIMSDDNDSEYNAAEEYSSEHDRGILSASFSSDPECSTGDSDFENNHKDTLRRSGRDKCKTIDLVTSSRRRVKKRNLDECEGSTSRNMRIKKSKSRQKASKRQSSRTSTVRPQRTAARHALSMFSQISGTSTDGDEFESEGSSSDSVLEPLNRTTVCSEAGKELEQDCGKGQEESANRAESIEFPQNGSKKRLVLKFSLRDHRKPSSLEDVSSTPHDELPQVIASGLSQANAGNSSTYGGLEPHSSSLGAMQLSVDEPRNDGEEKGLMHIAKDVAMMSTGDNKRFGLGEVKISSSICLSKDVTGSTPSLAINKGCENRCDGNDKNSTPVALEDQHGKAENVAACKDGHMPLSMETPNVTDHQKTSGPPKKSATILRIKTKGQSKRNFINGVDGSADAEGSVMEHGDKFQIVGRSTYSERKLLDSIKEKSSTSFRQECSSGLDKEDITECVRGHAEPVENELDTEIDYPDAEADALRRTRSMKMKATSRETSFVTRNYNNRGHESSGTSRSVENSSRKLHRLLLSEDWMPRSNLIVRSRSTRNRRNDININNYFPEGRRSNQYVRKQSWLTLSEHEEGYRYVPQLGDEVVYFMQGHKECIELGVSHDKLPQKLLKGIRAVEICKVKDLEYATSPGSGDSCCKLTLLFVDSDSPVCGKEYRFTMPDLTSSPDFVIEKSLYDYAMGRNWTIKDICLVWWRDENGMGGSWWDGQILSSQAKSHDFPDSPWERYSILYQTDPSERHLHSPWELHDPEEPWERSHIDPEMSNKLLSILAKLEHLVSKNKDYYGFQKLNEVAQKSDFANRFPVALSPELIQQRLTKNYYRSVEAVKHDLQVMMSNAESYFSSNAELSTKMNRLSDWFIKALSKL